MGERSAAEGSAPSPLTGAYLLVVLPQPHVPEHKDAVLHNITKGFLSWDKEDCHVDLEKELQTITAQAPEGEEARNGERLIQFASENLVTEVLIHPQLNTLVQCIRNLLSSFTRHRHIIHAGYTYIGNGSWILQDGTFSFADFLDMFQEVDVQRVLRAYENTVTIDIHCSQEGDWTNLRSGKEPFSKLCRVRLNPNDKLSASKAIHEFLDYLSPYLESASIEQLLEPSDVVGNIRFSHPTLYVFPGGQGDAALFGINGFNMLVDGGFSRKACFWDFIRHLDRLDAVLMTRLNNGNLQGIASLLYRKRLAQVYPQIGHFFCNLQERRQQLSPDGDKDKDPLLVNLIDQGQEIVSSLRQINLKPHPCYRDLCLDPINLYHKVGHGKLDMYVLSPSKDSREVRDFLAKWNSSDSKLFSSFNKKPGEFNFPLYNRVSVCALLVWQPANPNDNITRLLFPGSAPQEKIFEGLDKLKNLEFMRHAVCSAKSLSPSSSTMGLNIRSVSRPKGPAVIEKLPQSEIRQMSKNIETVKPAVKSDGTTPGITDTKPKQIKQHKPKQIEKVKEQIKTDVDNLPDKVKLQEAVKKSEKSREKPKKLVQKHIEKKPPKVSNAEKKVDSIKSSPTTPKKSMETKVNGIESKYRASSKTRLSPSATPAKSAKEENNRKVVELKSKEAPRPPKALQSRKDDSRKSDKKPISKKPQTTSPSKVMAKPSSPIKSAVTKSKKDLRKVSKTEKELTTDSSTVSTPSTVDAEVSAAKMKEEESVKEEVIQDEKEKQDEPVSKEAIDEGEKSKDMTPSEVNIEEVLISKEEEDEILIIEKVEIEAAEEAGAEQDTIEIHLEKVSGEVKESEKEAEGPLMDVEKAVEKVEEIKKDDEMLRTEKETKELITPEHSEQLQEEVQEIIQSATDIVAKTKAESQITDLPSDDQKVIGKDIPSSIMTSKDTEKDVKDKSNELLDQKNQADESQPDEKFSTTIESGATTAPTLPEDERIPLDEIKEGIEEKHVKEETKEKELGPAQKPEQPTSLPQVPVIPGTVFDQKTQLLRDIVKTPDEVADLPVHEEVDAGIYEGGEAGVRDLNRSKEDLLTLPLTKKHDETKEETVETSEELKFIKDGLEKEDKDKDLKEDLEKLEGTVEVQDLKLELGKEVPDKDVGTDQQKIEAEVSKEELEIEGEKKEIEISGIGGKEKIDEEEEAKAETEIFEKEDEKEKEITSEVAIDHDKMVSTKEEQPTEIILEPKVVAKSSEIDESLKVGEILKEPKQEGKLKEDISIQDEKDEVEKSGEEEMKHEKTPQELKTIPSPEKEGEKTERKDAEVKEEKMDTEITQESLSKQPLKDEVVCQEKEGLVKDEIDEKIPTETGKVEIEKAVGKDEGDTLLLKEVEDKKIPIEEELTVEKLKDKLIGKEVVQEEKHDLKETEDSIPDDKLIKKTDEEEKLTIISTTGMKDETLSEQKDEPIIQKEDLEISEKSSDEKEKQKLITTEGDQEKDLMKEEELTCEETKDSSEIPKDKIDEEVEVKEKQVEDKTEVDILKAKELKDLGEKKEIEAPIEKSKAVEEEEASPHVEEKETLPAIGTKELLLPVEKKKSLPDVDETEALSDIAEKEILTPTEKKVCPVSEEEKEVHASAEEKEAPATVEEKEILQPTEIKVSPVSAEKKEAPTMVEEKEAPAKVEEREVPTKVDKKEAPAKVEEKEAPAKEEEIKPPAKVEEKEVPAKVEEKEPPAKVEEKEAPAKIEEKESPAKVEGKEAPTKDEEKESPAKVEEKEAPAKDEEKESSAKVEEKEAPAKVEEKESPAIIEDKEVPVSTEEKEAPVLTEGKEGPVTIEKTEVSGEEKEAPASVGGKAASPAIEEKEAPPVIEEKEALPSVEEKETPASAEVTEAPPGAVEKETPASAEEKEALPDVEEKETPASAEEKETPVSAEDKEAHISAKEKETPVSTEEQEAPASTEKKEGLAEKKETSTPAEEKEAPVSAKEQEDFASTEKKEIHTEEKEVPGFAEEQESTVPIEKKDVHAEEKETPASPEKKEISTEEEEPPVTTEKKEVSTGEEEALVTTEKKEVSAEQKEAPASIEEKKDSPEEKEAPASIEEKKDSAEEKEAPVPADEKEAPVPADGKEAPVPADEKEAPVPADEKEAPVPADEKEALASIVEKEAPCAVDEKEAPPTIDKKETPAVGEIDVPSSVEEAKAPHIDEKKVISSVIDEKDVPSSVEGKEIPPKDEKKEAPPAGDDKDALPMDRKDEVAEKETLKGEVEDKKEPTPAEKLIKESEKEVSQLFTEKPKEEVIVKEISTSLHEAKYKLEEKEQPAEVEKLKDKVEDKKVSAVEKEADKEEEKETPIATDQLQDKEEEKEILVSKEAKEVSVIGEELKVKEDEIVSTTAEKLKDREQEKEVPTAEKSKEELEKEASEEKPEDKAEGKEAPKIQLKDVDKVKEQDEEKEATTAGKSKEKEKEQEVTTIEKAKEEEGEKEVTTDEKPKEKEEEQEVPTTEQLKGKEEEKEVTTDEKSKEKEKEQEVTTDERPKAKEEQAVTTTEQLKEKEEEKEVTTAEKPKEKEEEQEVRTIGKPKEEEEVKAVTTAEKLKGEEEVKAVTTIEKLKGEEEVKAATTTENLKEEEEVLAPEKTKEKEEKQEPIPVEILKHKVEEDVVTEEKLKDKESEKEKMSEIEKPKDKEEKLLTDDEIKQEEKELTIEKAEQEVKETAKIHEEPKEGKEPSGSIQKSKDEEKEEPKVSEKKEDQVTKEAMDEKKEVTHDAEPDMGEKPKYEVQEREASVTVEKPKDKEEEKDVAAAVKPTIDDKQVLSVSTEEPKEKTEGKEMPTVEKVKDVAEEKGGSTSGQAAEKEEILKDEVHKKEELLIVTKQDEKEVLATDEKQEQDDKEIAVVSEESKDEKEEKEILATADKLKIEEKKEEISKAAEKVKDEGKELTSEKVKDKEGETTSDEKMKGEKDQIEVSAIMERIEEQDTQQDVAVTDEIPTDKEEEKEISTLLEKAMVEGLEKEMPVTTEKTKDKEKGEVPAKDKDTEKKEQVVETEMPGATQKLKEEKEEKEILSTTEKPKYKEEDIELPVISEKAGEKDDTKEVPEKDVLSIEESGMDMEPSSEKLKISVLASTEEFKKDLDHTDQKYPLEEKKVSEIELEEKISKATTEPDKKDEATESTDSCQEKKESTPKDRTDISSEEIKDDKVIFKEEEETKPKDVKEKQNLEAKVEDKKLCKVEQEEELDTRKVCDEKEKSILQRETKPSTEPSIIDQISEVEIAKDIPSLKDKVIEDSKILAKDVKTEIIDKDDSTVVKQEVCEREDERIVKTDEERGEPPQDIKEIPLVHKIEKVGQEEKETKAETAQILKSDTVPLPTEKESISDTKDTADSRSIIDLKDSAGIIDEDKFSKSEVCVLGQKLIEPLSSEPDVGKKSEGSEQQKEELVSVSTEEAEEKMSTKETLQATEKNDEQLQDTSETRTDLLSTDGAKVIGIYEKDIEDGKEKEKIFKEIVKSEKDSLFQIADQDIPSEVKVTDPEEKTIKDGAQDQEATAIERNEISILNEKVVDGSKELDIRKEEDITEKKDSIPEKISKDEISIDITSKELIDKKDQKELEKEICSKAETSSSFEIPSSLVKTEEAPKTQITEIEKFDQEKDAKEGQGKEKSEVKIESKPLAVKEKSEDSGISQDEISFEDKIKESSLEEKKDDSEDKKEKEGKISSEPEVSKIEYSLEGMKEIVDKKELTVTSMGSVGKEISDKIETDQLDKVTEKMNGDKIAHPESSKSGELDDQTLKGKSMKSPLELEGKSMDTKINGYSHRDEDSKEESVTAAKVGESQVSTSSKILTETEKDETLKKEIMAVESSLEPTSTSIRKEDVSKVSKESFETTEQTKLSLIPDIEKEKASQEKKGDIHLPIEKQEKKIFLEEGQSFKIETDSLPTVMAVAELRKEYSRSATPGSDAISEKEFDVGGQSTPHSDISSGQVSRAATHMWESSEGRQDSQHYDSDEDIPGSPMSITSHIHSPPQFEYDLGKTKESPMTSSFYGSLPEDPTESPEKSTKSKVASMYSSMYVSKYDDKDGKEAGPSNGKHESDHSHSLVAPEKGLDIDFHTAVLEHKIARGEDLQIQGKEGLKSEPKEHETKETKKGMNGSSTVVLPESHSTDSRSKQDPIEQWGKPLGLPSPLHPSSTWNPYKEWGKPLSLPSPAPPTTKEETNGDIEVDLVPSSAKTTPKKVAKMNAENNKVASNATGKEANNKPKRSDSPVKRAFNKDSRKSNFTPIYMDLSYVPHHGNSHYANVEFFKRVRARYYVFSGTEPSKDVFNALLEAKQTWEEKDLEVTIIPTYDTDTLGYWITENEDTLAKFKIDLSPSASRCTINLQDHETSCSAYRLEF